MVDYTECKIQLLDIIDSMDEDDYPIMLLMAERLTMPAQCVETYTVPGIDKELYRRIRNGIAARKRVMAKRRSHAAHKRIGGRGATGKKQIR